ncbi:MFS transporter [Streptomyces sp. NPDC052496]|uniref:MFS transporter n=1 Tax=Streptomyces sp. NPDC052496 TaxID=3154951 RepID=UPI003432B6FE
MTQANHGVDVAVRSRRQGTGVMAAGVLAATNFLVVFDGTVVTVALPAIETGLGLRNLDAQWIITVYTVALGGCLLLGGRSGDRFGRRRMLATGLGLLACGLLVSGAASNLAWMLTGRAVQGLGAALAVPNAFALISSVPDRSARNRLFAVSGVAGSSGSACGAIVGGLVEQTLGWRFVFLLSACVALCAAAAVPWSVADSKPEPKRSHQMDVPAAALLATAFMLLVFAVTNVERSSLVAPSTLLALAGAGLVFTSFVFRERRARIPLVPLAVLRVRTLRIAMLVMPAQVFAYNGTVYVALLYFQKVRHYSTLEAGAAFVPLGLAAFAGSPVASRLLSGSRSRWSVSAGALTACALGMTSIALAAHSGPYAFTLLPAQLLVGFGIAIAAVTLNAAAGEHVHDREKSTAYGLFETSTHVAGAMSVAMLATVIAAFGGAEQSAVLGYQTAFAIIAAAAAFGTILCLWLGRNSVQIPSRSH